MKHNVLEFRAIYDREIARGRKNTQALFIVSKRWLYHTHSMLKNVKPYRERMPLGSRRGNRESFGSSGMERNSGTTQGVRYKKNTVPPAPPL